MVVGNLKANALATGPILGRLMESIRQEPPASKAHSALADALMTPPDVVPDATRHRLDLFTSPYWGSVTAS